MCCSSHASTVLSYSLLLTYIDIRRNVLRDAHALILEAIAAPPPLARVLYREAHPRRLPHRRPQPFHLTLVTVVMAIVVTRHDRRSDRAHEEGPLVVRRERPRHGVDELGVAIALLRPSHVVEHPRIEPRPREHVPGDVRAGVVVVEVREQFRGLRPGGIEMLPGEGAGGLVGRRRLIIAAAETETDLLLRLQPSEVEDPREEQHGRGRRQARRAVRIRDGTTTTPKEGGEAPGGTRRVVPPRGRSERSRDATASSSSVVAVPPPAGGGGGGGY